MAKRPYAAEPHIPERLPPSPSPSATTASDGMERARERARCFLPDTVELLAGIALSPDSEAALHTRMLCAKQLVDIAGVIPQATPTPPSPLASPAPHGHPRDGSDPD